MKSFKVVVILLSLLLSFQPMQAMAADSGADAANLSNAEKTKPKSDNINKPIAASKATLKKHERLVLMPLRLTEDDKQLQGAMEAALVEGLQQQYEVFAGEIVSQKAREIFLKESRDNTKKYCDETRCMQNIAEAFQTEYIATVSVTKQKDGYFLALIIQNIFDNLVVYSNSVPCEKCDTFTVVNKLKELAHQSVAEKAVVEDESILSNFWFNVGVKNWSTSFEPGDGTSRKADNALITATLGYEKFFFNFSLSGGMIYKNPNNSGEEIEGGSGGFGIGYIPIPHLLVSIGYKGAGQSWHKIPAPYHTDVYTATPASQDFITVGASYSHALSDDSPYSIYGGLTYGQRTLVGETFNTGSTGGSSAFTGIDVGGNYAVTKSFRVALFYRAEQWDDLVPTSYYAQSSPFHANVAMTKMKKSGPGIGVSYAF